jgi:predicted RNA binding protein YcfA (HicA-like mRNA interferase family)
VGDQFPAMKARVLLRILERGPLSYRVVRQTGSHRRMRSPCHPPLTYAFHASDTVPGGVVRKILVRDIGLSEAEARELL